MPAEALNWAEPDTMASELPSPQLAADDRLARLVAVRLAASGIVPPGRLRLSAHSGTLTVSGLVDWQFQRQAVIDHVRHHPGVRHVLDEIEVRPLLDAGLLMQRIDGAVRGVDPALRLAISVEVEGSRVILAGHAPSLALRELVENTAWSTPGVTMVENRVAVC